MHESTTASTLNCGLNNQIVLQDHYTKLTTAKVQVFELVVKTIVYMFE